MLKQVQHDWDIVITGILDYFANARNDSYVNLLG